MKKLLTCALASLSVMATSSTFAFTQSQAQELQIKKVTATCINPVTNTSVKYSGSPYSVYISENTGLLVVKTTTSIITMSPSYCVITGTP